MDKGGLMPVIINQRRLHGKDRVVPDQVSSALGMEPIVDLSLCLFVVYVDELLQIKSVQHCQ